MNLECGLDALKALLRNGDPDVYLQFTTLESRLRGNIRDEQAFGSSESVRSERARIIQEFNRLSLHHCGISFNELCVRELPGQRHSAERGEQPLDYVDLHSLLAKYLDLEDLRTLCFCLGVDFDSLRGEGKAAKARELVIYCQSRDRLSELARGIRRMRPDIKELNE